MVYMICANCGRKLKSAASREAGYGPVCYKRIFGISLRGRCPNNALETAAAHYHALQGQMTVEEYLHMVSG